MNSLLIISCSQRKIESPGPLAAINRYDGPAYRTLRKLEREGRFPENLDVVIISAKYGLLHYEQPIENYDQCMTPKRAVELRPKIQADLEHLIWDARGYLFSRGAYDEVFINLSKVYMSTLQGFHWGLIETDEASGGIGQKTSQMKAWIEGNLVKPN